jgi:hypothetical protein
MNKSTSNIAHHCAKQQHLGVDEPAEEHEP